MKKEYADKWVKALRSGKYIQGKKYLRKDDEFCCLGVLCDILKIKNKKFINDTYIYGTQNGERTSSVLPYEAMKITGMKTSDGRILTQNHDITGFYTLTRANDMGVSFYEISNWIEQYYKEI